MKWSSVELGMLRCFFFNDTGTTEIYPLSLHDALPIYRRRHHHRRRELRRGRVRQGRLRRHRAALRRDRRGQRGPGRDRKSTRLNSSHANISYAVFCLKKKKQTSATSIPHQTTHTLLHL